MMMMKEDERKVLKQIRELMGSLGSDSYVATAFEGCAEIAESNIDNDFMCSMKQQNQQRKNQEKRSCLYQTSRKRSTS